MVDALDARIHDYAIILRFLCATKMIYNLGKIASICYSDLFVDLQTFQVIISIRWMPKPQLKNYYYLLVSCFAVLKPSVSYAFFTNELLNLFVCTLNWWSVQRSNRYRSHGWIWWNRSLPLLVHWFRNVIHKFPLSYKSITQNYSANINNNINDAFQTFHTNNTHTKLIIYSVIKTQWGENKSYFVDVKNSLKY